MHKKMWKGIIKPEEKAKYNQEGTGNKQTIPENVTQSSLRKHHKTTKWQELIPLFNNLS